MSSKTIFLDRDGVLNVDHGYVYKIDELQILPTVKESLVRLKSNGFKLIVISNQSGVARGMFQESDVRKFNEELNRQLDKEGQIDAFYVCPFHPDAISPEFRIDSDYRKPGTGMLDQAVSEHDVDVKQSYLIGDKASDIECAINFGIPAFQMESRYDAHDSIEKRYQTLKEVVDIILSR